MSSTSKIIQKYYGQQSIPEIKKAGSRTFYFAPQKPTSLYTKLKLPYEAPQHPGIPSIEKIEEGMSKNRFVSDVAIGPVCRIGAVVVKRSSSAVPIQEAEDLLYLQATGCKIRTPTVYAAFSREIIHEGKIYQVYYMVQEYIEGEHVTSALWLSLDTTARRKICSS